MAAEAARERSRALELDGRSPPAGRARARRRARRRAGGRPRREALEVVRAQQDARGGRAAAGERQAAQVARVHRAVESQRTRSHAQGTGRLRGCRAVERTVVIGAGLAGLAAATSSPTAGTTSSCSRRATASAAASGRSGWRRRPKLAVVERAGAEFVLDGYVELRRLARRHRARARRHRHELHVRERGGGVATGTAEMQAAGAEAVARRGGGRRRVLVAGSSAPSAWPGRRGSRPRPDPDLLRPGERAAGRRRVLEHLAGRRARRATVSPAATSGSRSRWRRSWRPRAAAHAGPRGRRPSRSLAEAIARDARHG